MTPSLELAHHVLPESIDRTLAGECHQRDLARLPGLEAHRGAGRDVEPHAARLGAVKLQRRIGLEEMIVRAHLDRPVAGIRHRQGDGLAAGIELDLAVLDEGFARNHWLPHVFRCAQAAPLAPPLPACGERSTCERSEASRVRARVHKLRLVATPPHPDSIAPLRCARNPTSPRTRGEVAQVARHCEIAGHLIGSCTVTSLVPSGNVASTWMSWIISAMPSITCARVSTWAPACISSATLLPSRAPSRMKSVISATASG